MIGIQCCHGDGYITTLAIHTQKFRLTNFKLNLHDQKLSVIS